MKTDSIYREQLNAHGCKATPAMVAVLRILEEKKIPMSAGRVSLALKKKINTSTVYRILERFKEKDIVRYVDLQHGHIHYEIKTDDHHHLICTTCGMIEDVDQCDVELVTKRILKRSTLFSSISGHTLEFFGICNRCQSKKK